MTLDAYDAVIELMRHIPGVSIRDADSRESTSRYLQRNPGVSVVAESLALRFSREFASRLNPVHT